MRYLFGLLFLWLAIGGPAEAMEKQWDDPFHGGDTECTTYQDDTGTVYVACTTLPSEMGDQACVKVCEYTPKLWGYGYEGETCSTECYRTSATRTIYGAPPGGPTQSGSPAPGQQHVYYDDPGSTDDDCVEVLFCEQYVSCLDPECTVTTTDQYCYWLDQCW